MDQNDLKKVIQSTDDANLAKFGKQRATRNTQIKPKFNSNADLNLNAIQSSVKLQ